MKDWVPEYFCEPGVHSCGNRDVSKIHAICLTQIVPTQYSFDNYMYIHTHTQLLHCMCIHIRVGECVHDACDQLRMLLIILLWSCLTNSSILCIIG